MIMCNSYKSSRTISIILKMIKNINENQACGQYMATLTCMIKVRYRIDSNSNGMIPLFIEFG